MASVSSSQRQQHQQGEGSAAAARGFRKMCSSASSMHSKATVNRAVATSSTRWTLHVGKHISAKEVLFRTQVNLALAEEDLDGVYEAWCKWAARGCGDVPLDNRELMQLRHAGSHVARNQLRIAVSSCGAESVANALQVAEAVARRFPYAIAVRASPEYMEATCMHQEAEKASCEEPRNDDASTDAGSDRGMCEMPETPSQHEEDEDRKGSVQQGEDTCEDRATETNEASALVDCEVADEHGGQAEQVEEKEAEEIAGQEWQEQLDQQGEEEWEEEWQEEKEEEEVVEAEAEEQEEGALFDDDESF